MQPVDVSARVWARLLDVRDGDGCLCSRDWSISEQRALALYGPLAQVAGETQVVAQIGQSLDGRIATSCGDAKDISGRDGLAHLHRLRAMSDAVVIGVETALHDNPQLTVRLAEGRNPTRVVIDPSGRLPDEIGLLSDRAAPCIVVQAVKKRRPAHVEVIELPREGWICPQKILSALQDRGHRSILVEGGGITIAQFLEAGLLDRLHVAVAPLLIGAGPQGLTTSPIAGLDQALRPQTEVYALGTDVLFDCILDSSHAHPHPYPLPCRTEQHTPMRVVASS